MKAIYNLKQAAGIGALLMASAVLAQATELTISSGLPQTHNWVGHHMDPFMTEVEAATGGAVTFMPFYGGELVGIGRALDGLTSGTIDIAAPLLSPYHEGRFPLSDVTQLPTYGTDSHMVTRAFQNLLASDEELVDGKSFYQYEIADKNIHAWALGATPAYSISTTGQELTSVEDFGGLSMRAGSAIHTIVLEKLGATPVTMPATQAYEALSRGTLDGIVLAVSDWPTYSMDQVLSYTVTGVSIGHWESYLAISDMAWNQLSDDEKVAVDAAADKVTAANSDELERQNEANAETAAANYNARFVPIEELPQEVQEYIADALAQTWIQWIETTEASGHPARAAARLYARLILAEGGKLPEGVADYLEL